MKAHIRTIELTQALKADFSVRDLSEMKEYVQSSDDENDSEHNFLSERSLKPPNVRNRHS